MRDPLLHFLLLGALLFVSFELAYAKDASTRDEIVVTQGRVDQLIGRFTRTWQRPPTKQEVRRLIDGFVRDEVLYREAVAMGLDRDDVTIRRRMRQKIEFLTQDFVDRVQPSDQQLSEYVAAHPDSFRTDPRYTYKQIYLNPDRHKGKLDADVKRLLAELPSEGATEKLLAEKGDPFLLPCAFRAVERREVRATFGKPFANALAELELGKWHGPVRSGYGVHVVLVEARIPARMPELSEIRQVAVREWTAANRRKVQDEFYQRVRAKYRIRLDFDSTASTKDG